MSVRNAAIALTPHPFALMTQTVGSKSSSYLAQGKGNTNYYIFNILLNP
jgi:hypothetical protein